MKACSCWTGPVSLHSGHCCFHAPNDGTCHEDEGFAARVLLGLSGKPFDTAKTQGVTSS